MADEGRTVTIDLAAWRRVERQAEVTGQSPAEVIQASFDRGLAGEVLAELRARVRARQPLDDEDAIALVAEERRTMRDAGSSLE